MRYFTYMAEQSFKTAPSGERLYFRSGPWTRPYVIPDAATEQVIYRKLVWLLRIEIGGLIIAQPFFIMLFPELIRNPMYFVAYLVGLVAAFWLVNLVVMAPNLRHLQRAPARLSMKSFYVQMAEKHSFLMLGLGLAACFMFVAVGGLMLALGESIVPAIFAIVFFSICAVAWGYALSLKRSQAS